MAWWAASDLHGNLTVDVSGDMPVLARQDGLAACWISTTWARWSAAARRAPVAEQVPAAGHALHTERLRQTNAEVDYSAAPSQSRDFPLRSLSTHISLENGVLDLKPLAFGFTQGKLSRLAEDRRAQGCAGDLGRCAPHRYSCREFHQGQRQAHPGHAGSARRADRHAAIRCTRWRPPPTAPSPPWCRTGGMRHSAWRNGRAWMC